MSSHKLEKIEAKIKNLQNKKQKIKEKHLQQTAKLINKLDLSGIDDSTLYGALLFVKQEVENNSDLAIQWKAMGQKK